MREALLVALAYYVCQLLDGVIGFQTMTRPIVLGSITGILCGDVKTGVIMAAELEAIYMGISGIGGVVASDYRTSTVIGVALTILSGITMEQGLTVAVAVGALMTTVTPITNTIMSLLQPIQTKTANEGNVKKFWRNMWIQAIFVRYIINTTILFLCVFFGSDAISNVINSIPAWLLKGLSAAGGMLVVVGLCLTTQAIYSSSTVIWVLLGFVLAKYLGLGTLPIAIIALIIAYVILTRNYKLQELERKMSHGTSGINGGDDFYG